MMLRGLKENVYMLLSRVGEIRCREKNVLAAEPYPTIAKFYYSSVTKGGEISVIWFDHLGSANLAKDYFNYLWRGSEE
ncbi:MAG: hypothetical protein QXO49_01180 [Candidatus Bathyarchaeia archaeon]